MNTLIQRSVNVPLDRMFVIADSILSLSERVLFDSFVGFNACLPSSELLNLFLKHGKVTFYLIHLRRRQKLRSARSNIDTALMDVG
jgi:hypothetical protein